jgi:Ca-activated chloride channel family protein
MTPWAAAAGAPLVGRVRLAVALAVLASAAATAQVYRGGTDLVLLSVTVTDGAGRHVPGLRREDFRIYEDGVPQEITHFSDQPEPVSLSLLIDTSTSMESQNKLALAQQAASGFIGRLGPEDVAQLIDFDSQTRIIAPFTGDKAALAQALVQAKAGGSTSLYNAVYTSLSELRRLRGQLAGAPRRQAIVLLSDGEDTSSIVPADDVLDLAKRSEVTVYAVAMVVKDAPPSRGWTEAESVLRSLTRETGGRVFLVHDPQQLPAIYIQIADELANQYSVAYMSSNAKRDGTWRRITMQVLKGDAMPRTRAGYYAPRDRP